MAHLGLMDDQQFEDFLSIWYPRPRIADIINQSHRQGTDPYSSCYGYTFLGYRTMDRPANSMDLWYRTIWRHHLEPDRIIEHISFARGP